MTVFIQTSKVPLQSSAVLFCDLQVRKTLLNCENSILATRGVITLCLFSNLLLKLLEQNTNLICGATSFAMTFFPEASFRSCLSCSLGHRFIASGHVRVSQPSFYVPSHFLPALLVLRFPLPHRLSFPTWPELASVLVFLLNSEMLTGPVTLI